MVDLSLCLNITICFHFRAPNNKPVITCKTVQIIKSLSQPVQINNGGGNVPFLKRIFNKDEKSLTRISIYIGKSDVQKMY